ncbi:MAG TPA: CoA transferase [Dehalococcoidia bacterium]|nr:CoA transferase [Dehalococcoidia bacterium]
MSALPLQGVRIIDACIYWAGPMATMLLADLGAEVVKIESIQRLDFLRLLGGWPSADGYEFSAAFNGTNRNKYGITLNLNHPRGREIFKRLVEIGDVVTENFSPRVMENWGLTYDALKEIKPGLIMLSMPGFGTTGPWRNYVTFGPNVEMVSGMPTISGYPGGEPMMTGYIADPAAGLMGAVAVVVALQHRHRTGKGQHIDLSQIEAFTAFMGQAIIDYSMNNRMQPRRGNRHPSMAPHGVYPCKGDDDWVTITVSSDEEWDRLCDATGNPSWASEPKYTDAASRYSNHDELDKLMGEWTRQHDKHEVMQILQGAGVAAAPVLSYAEFLDDAHIKDRGFFETVTRPLTGTHPYPGFPVKLSETPVTIRRPAPTLGQDNEYILKNLLGMTDDEINELVEAEIIGTKPQGWAYSMEADEAISKLKDIHARGDDSKKET